MSRGRDSSISISINSRSRKRRDVETRSRADRVIINCVLFADERTRTTRSERSSRLSFLVFFFLSPCVINIRYYFGFRLPSLARFPLLESVSPLSGKKKWGYASGAVFQRRAQPSPSFRRLTHYIFIISIRGSPTFTSLMSQRFARRHTASAVCRRAEPFWSVYRDRQPSRTFRRHIQMTIDPNEISTYLHGDV